ncbi:hypothetical protein SAMN04488024_105357 [Pedobacter soli]|uniref:Thioredoxin-like n=2 Tax=Pedobacter soli TaxID=390242 RepID=A0A1G6UID3_9SPHI|nr:hypothetical protein SAMN04488024_105357 [Pedobacter soli]
MQLNCLICFYRNLKDGFFAQKMLRLSNEVAKMYGIQSIPANFLIDPNGKIVAKGLREQALQDKLQELLGNKSK